MENVIFFAKKNHRKDCEIRILSKDQRIADVKIWADKLDYSFSPNNGQF